jgi:hypothetical protein
VRDSSRTVMGRISSSAVLAVRKACSTWARSW